MTWTIAQLETLGAMAGEYPVSQIVRELRQPEAQVRALAVAFGFELDYYQRTMDWCPICATWRTMNPECRVCELREQLQELKADNAAAFRLLAPDEQKEHTERDGQRQASTIEKPRTPSLAGLKGARRKAKEEQIDKMLEEWEVATLEAEKDRVKHETFRIRQRLEKGQGSEIGENPGLRRFPRR